MFALTMNLKKHEPLSLNISCAAEDLSFRGMTRETSRNDLCLEVPTTKIKLSLTDFINKDVTVSFENVILNGSISWYTIEGDYYFIGIRIARTHQSAWKGILAERPRLSLRTEVHHA